jgi:hypothetical protein
MSHYHPIPAQRCGGQGGCFLCSPEDLLIKNVNWTSNFTITSSKMKSSLIISQEVRYLCQNYSIFSWLSPKSVPLYDQKVIADRHNDNNGL